MTTLTRRTLLRRLGLSAAALPFLPPLARLRAATPSKMQRVIFMFSPNGVVVPEFWPEGAGADFRLKRILAPLEPFKNRLLTLDGISNKVRGDGDGHMRGISCLLTGAHLSPGNIQGGSDTPAGWPTGPSIDQEIKNFLQRHPETTTRLGSLELGVAVPNRADPWTRWVYAGANQPLAPLSNPYEVFEKLYGQVEDRESIGSVLDEVTEDLRRVASSVSPEEKTLLDQHATFVREMEVELQQAAAHKLRQSPPSLEVGADLENDGIPKVTVMQTDLLVNALANDITRVASLQFTNSVGQARMRWLGVNEGHHGLSHDPDGNAASQEKLTKINTWFCEQLAALAHKLDAIPEPGGEGSLLDNTTIIWTNELGKGNSHSHDKVPFVLVGGGLGFQTGRAHQFDSVAHNRLWVTIANAFGHGIKTFGSTQLSEGGPLALS